MRTFNISTQIYVDKNDPLKVILAAAAFAILSTTNIQKGYSLSQLVFGIDMILPKKYEVYWDLIRHRNQAQINKGNIRKNRHRVDHNYKVLDNVVLTKHNAYKYEMKYTVLFVITYCFTNGTVNLQYGVT